MTSQFARAAQQHIEDGGFTGPTEVVRRIDDLLEEAFPQSSPGVGGITDQIAAAQMALAGALSRAVAVHGYEEVLPLVEILKGSLDPVLRSRLEDEGIYLSGGESGRVN